MDGDVLGQGYLSLLGRDARHVMTQLIALWRDVSVGNRTALNPVRQVLVDQRVNETPDTNLVSYSGTHLPGGE